MATSSSNKLVEEINDQFLICKICYDVYRQPKTLSCLHTFCADCLERHQEAELERSYRYLLYSRAITCPICRKKTDLPAGGVKRLPDNFLVANLADIVNRRRGVDRVQRCEICQADGDGARTNTAVAKCLDCSKLLCRRCLELHRRTKVTQSHGLFDIEVEKDIVCKVHQDEVVRFYCELCEVCVCVVCTFQEHKGHEVSSFTEGIEKYRHSLDALLVKCRQRIGQLKDQLRMIDKCETDLKRTEERITEAAIESVAAIRKKEREMVRDLYLAFGEESIDFIKEKEFIHESIESLQSTCNLTDMILKDRSVELLLLKKEIQQKLNVLLQRKWIQPPDIVTQRVQFVPGRAELGNLKIGDASGEEGDGRPEVDSNRSAGLGRVGSGVSRAVDTQTALVRTSDSATSMGASVLDLGRERVTQTEVVLRKETGTLTCRDQGKPVMVTACTLAVPDTKDIHTMTVGTPTVKRKIQTEKVTHADRETNTIREPPRLRDASVNTRPSDMAERSTMTKVLRHQDQVTSTDQLIATRDREMVTEYVATRTCATETALPDTHNRGTLTARPFSSDKKISTTRLVLRTQETNTPHVIWRDSAVTAKVYGHDVGITTRTTVTTNTGTGDSDVTVMEPGPSASPKTTSDKQTSCHVTSSDSGNMTDVTGTNDQSTFTSYFNMADKVTATEQVACQSADTNTDVIAHEHKAVHVDNIDEKVKVDMLDDVCQTMISMIDAVLWPSMMPVHAGTSTEPTEVVDQVTSTNQTSFDTVGINTEFCPTTDVGIGDASCATSDMASDAMCHGLSTLDAYTETEVTATEDAASCTLPVYTSEYGTSTETIATKDASVDSFPGYRADAETNTTLDVIVKSDTSTNTSAVRTVDNSTSVIVPTKDAQIGTIRIPADDGSTNTEAPASSESATSMGGWAGTTESYVNTIRIDLTSTGSGAGCAHVADRCTATEPPAVMTKHTETDRCRTATRQTETDVLETREVGVCSQVEVVVRGTDALPAAVTNQETFTEPVLRSTIGVGTTSVLSSSKGVATEPRQMRECGTHAHVQSVEKATYMPRAITITTGTSTKPMFTSEKGLSTDRVQQDDRSTNTAPARFSTRETTMHSDVSTRDRRVNTDIRTMVDRQSDPIVLARETKFTNTAQVERCSAGVGTPEVFTLSTGTTTHHRVSYADQETVTASRECLDRATDAVQPETKEQQVEAKPETKSVGVLKRPHTITRGAGSPYVTLCTTSTSPNLPYVADQGTMVRVETENRSTSGVPFEVVDRGTGTPAPRQVERSTEMTPVQMEQKECSPIRDLYADRGCSPVCVQTSCERETSPVAWPISDQATTVRPACVDSHTSTVEIDLISEATGMPHVYLTDRASSPIDVTPQMETVHRGTSMPRIILKDAASVAEPHTEAVGVNTWTPARVERESTPIRIAVHERGISATVSTEDRDAGTPHVSTSEKATWKRPMTSHSSTSMPQVSYSEKETCTPRVHFLHKNTWTENMTMADKQTNTVTDITSAYRQSVAGGDRPLMITRGTTMAEAAAPSGKQTPPPSSESTTVERASSPIKAVMVDKGVSVKKGEILEPVDTYQSAGSAKKPRRVRPRPRLASIEEDSSESSVESLEDENARTMSPLLFPALTPVSRRVPRPRMSIAGVLHRERLLPATPRMGRGAVTAFSSEGRGSASPIVCRVDTATNTAGVTTETRGTSTDRGTTTDRGVSTEVLPMESRMAECISKLRTVRNRLEPKQQTGDWGLPRRPTLGIAMRSKSLGDSLNDQEVAPLGQSPLNTSGSSDGGSSHGDSDDKVSGSRQKARKKRLDINQLLRSSSLPERDSSPPLSPPPPPPPPPAAAAAAAAGAAPTPMLVPKPKIRTVYPQVIPKLNIDDFKLKPTKDISKKSSRVSISSARKPSPRRRGSSPGSESRRQKDKDVPTAAGAPPEPPRRSSSLKRALLAVKTGEGAPTGKDDGLHQK